MSKFAEIFDDITKQGTKIPTNRYLEYGTYPIIDQGHSEIAGYTNEVNGLFTDVPAIIFGDHTRIIKYVETPCFLGADGVKLLKAKDTIANYKYLYYALCNADIPNTGYNRHFKWLKEVDIPDYPADEQNTIVAQLEKIDGLVALRKQQLSKLDELVKSRFIEMFEKCEFDVQSFGEVCEFLRNGANIKQTKGAGGFPITRIETLSNDVFNVNRLGYADITNIEKYRGYILQKGDILISHINSTAYLGRAVQYRGELDVPVIHGMNLLCARLKKTVLSDYVEAYFKTKKAKDYISTITKKAVNQASITTTDLKQMSIPIPPIELQNQFTRFVEQTDKLKFEIKKSLEKLETLKKTLMQKYFG